VPTVIEVKLKGILTSRRAIIWGSRRPTSKSSGSSESRL
jgi:hypothetical protein